MEVGTSENSSAITNTKNMEVRTTENSSAITNKRIHGGWNNREFAFNNKYKETWRLEQLRIHLQ